MEKTLFTGNEFMQLFFLFILFFSLCSSAAFRIMGLFMLTLLFAPWHAKVPTEQCFFSTGWHTPDPVICSREDLPASIAESEPSDTVLSFQRQVSDLGWYAEKLGERNDQSRPEIIQWNGPEPGI